MLDDQDVPVIEVLWLPTTQSMPLSSNNFQFIAVATGYDFTRYLVWLKNQDPTGDLYEIVSSSFEPEMEQSQIWICFKFNRTDAGFNKSVKSLATMFNLTWKDEHWTNGLPHAL